MSKKALEKFLQENTDSSYKIFTPSGYYYAKCNGCMKVVKFLGKHSLDQHL